MGGRFAEVTIGTGSRSGMTLFNNYDWKRSDSTNENG